MCLGKYAGPNRQTEVMHDVDQRYRVERCLWPVAINVPMHHGHAVAPIHPINQFSGYRHRLLEKQGSIQHEIQTASKTLRSVAKAGKANPGESSECVANLDIPHRPSPMIPIQYTYAKQTPTTHPAVNAHLAKSLLVVSPSLIKSKKTILSFTLKLPKLTRPFHFDISSPQRVVPDNRVR